MSHLDESGRKIFELEEKVRILQLENDQLAERAEDTLLLGLIAEQISIADDTGEVLEYGLERISVLKDVPFCACCLLTGNKATIVKSYLSFSDEEVGNRTFEFPETVLLRLAAGHCLLNLNECGKEGISIKLKTGSFVPLSAICIPFRVRYSGANMFFFGDDRSKDRLPRIADMLQRVTELMTSRIDNICLFQELQALNNELDRKVEERTRELQESETRFRQFFENQPAYCYMVSLDGIVLDVNKSALRVLGYKKEEIIGRPLKSIYASESLPKMIKGFETWKETGKLTNVEMVIRSKDGDKRTVLLSSDVVKDNDGNVIHSVSVQQDITERKLAEEQLKRLFTAVEHAGEIIVLTDSHGTILYVNPAFESTTGYGCQEVIGKNPRILQSGKHDKGFYQNMWETLLSGQVWRGRFINKKKDGALYEETATISPIRDEAGRVVNYVAVKRDVTGESLLHRQLIQAQKMESIGTLAGGIAHDFNNLLQVIIGYSDMLLLSKRATDPEYEGLHAILQAGRDGAELAKRILAFSRRLEPNTRPVNLNNEIARVQKMLERTISKMIRIEIVLAENLMTVNADPSQMEQLLLNLAVNAQHAMPDGGLLTIETANVTLDEDYSRTHLDVEPGRYVLLSVSDTGHGMDKEVLEHIFEPFYTTKGTGEGTGLGLAMVFGIVKSHKGHIICYSEPGAGTKFKIYFRAIVQKIEQDVAVAQEMPACGTETILLVDDEKSILELGEQMLRMAGYRVLAATNGREALEIYRSNKDRIDLVILDLMMPEMGGKQCLEGLLKINPRVKVLITSGYSANGPTKDALAAGARGFVDKPYDMKRVLKAIRQVLDAE